MRRLVITIFTAVVAAALSGALPAAAVTNITGGEAASEPYRFMVSLQDRSGDHFCGGSLVAPRVVLTAAHCAEGESPQALQVMLGSHKLSDPGKVHLIKKIVIHPKWASDANHDVALLQLAKPSSQAPIRLLGLSEDKLWKPGDVARVIGWGASIFLVGPGTNDLMQVDVPIVSDGDCAEVYGTQGFDPKVEVCAGETTGGKDSCQGDSGGPLMVEDRRGRWAQMGVVSWGLGCGWPALPGVYARIADNPLHNWLQTHITTLN